MDFLGLDLPRITGVLATEYAEVETRDEFVDLTFWLENGEILHIEEQSELTKDDLIRFAHYDLRIFSKHRVNIHTVVLSPAFSNRSSSVVIDTGCLHYSVSRLVIREKNADEVLERINKEIESGRPVNELELIFAPLMESRFSVKDILFKTIILEKQIKDENLKNKIIALTMVVSNRLVEPEILDKIWEEIKMLKILKYAEDKGKEQGIEEGIEKGRIEEKRNMMERMLVKKFGPLSTDLLQKIQNMDNIMLDILSFEFLDFQSIDDLHSFMKKMNL